MNDAELAASDSAVIADLMGDAIPMDTQAAWRETIDSLICRAFDLMVKSGDIPTVPLEVVKP